MDVHAETIAVAIAEGRKAPGRGRSRRWDRRGDLRCGFSFQPAWWPGAYRQTPKI